MVFKVVYSLLVRAGIAVTSSPVYCMLFSSVNFLQGGDRGQRTTKNKLLSRYSLSVHAKRLCGRSNAVLLLASLCLAISWAPHEACYRGLNFVCCLARGDTFAEQVYASLQTADPLLLVGVRRLYLGSVWLRPRGSHCRYSCISRRRRTCDWR